LAVVTLTLLIATSASAAEMLDASGQWWYVLERDGVTITGCEEPDGDLLIPNELDGYAVIGIGDHAFSEYYSLASVIIPDSVRCIGDGAFYTCTGLTSVFIGEGVTSIGRYTFLYTSLMDIDISPANPAYAQIDGVLFDKRFQTLIAYPSGRIGEYSIPEGVVSIGVDAFSVCKGLTSVIIPDSVTSIGDSAFSWCDSLNNVNIPDSVTSVGINPFAGSPLVGIDVSPASSAYAQIDGVLFDKQLETLIAYPSSREGKYSIPDSVTSIGSEAFSGCKNLTSVIISDSVSSIGEEAFTFCYSLANVTIPAGVTNIGDRAFAYCYRLTNVTIPISVTSIGVNPFGGSPLSYIDVSPDNPIFEQIDGVLFDKQKKKLISYPMAIGDAYTVPEGVLHIGDWAFGYSDNLGSVTIPASVTSIGIDAFDFFAVDNITLSVMRGSYAEQYAEESNTPFVYTE